MGHTYIPRPTMQSRRWGSDCRIGVGSWPTTDTTQIRFYTIRYDTTGYRTNTYKHTASGRVGRGTPVRPGRRSTCYVGLSIDTIQYARLVRVPAHIRVRLRLQLRILRYATLMRQGRVVEAWIEAARIASQLKDSNYSDAGWTCLLACRY
jgi:hypothetical protein